MKQPNCHFATQQNSPVNLVSDLPDYLKRHGFGDVHIKYDPATELLAIIAIHHDKFPTAIGGCRCLSYSSYAAALEDCLKLARMMSYKTAISDLAWGGAKAVVLKPQNLNNRKEFYQAFARFVHELGGRYVTSIDSGTELADLDTIAGITPYVTGLSPRSGSHSDPSLATALGVLHGIEAAVKFKMGKSSLAGLKVAVQGVGHVGYQLCKQLHARGAKLIVADVNSAAVNRCVDEFKAQQVDSSDIYASDCDVFAPCALGSSLTANTVLQLNASIVAGSANNQLSDDSVAELMLQADILYAPDYVINAGGVILATGTYEQRSEAYISSRLENIYPTLTHLFNQAREQGLSTTVIAERMVQQRIGR